MPGYIENCEGCGKEKPIKELQFHDRKILCVDCLDRLRRKKESRKEAELETVAR